MITKSKKIKWLYVFLFCITLFLFISFTYHSVDINKAGKGAEISSTSSSDLSREEYQEALTQAKQGDVFAMERIVMYDGIYKSVEENSYWQNKITEAAIAGDEEARRFAPDWSKSKSLLDKSD